MTSTEANNLTILDLPVDILSLILQPLVTSETSIQLCPCTPSPINPVSVLLSHPALHAIATPLLYASNEFVLDVTGPHAQHIRRELLKTPGSDERLPGRAVLLSTPDALRRVARMQVRIDRLRGWVGAGVVPLLAELAVQGGLDHLTVWVRTPGERRAQVQVAPRRKIPGEEGTDLYMFARPPLEGLLRVLADPYLLSARLWVDARHAKAWCRFHAGGCGAAAEGWTGGGAREPAEAVEIDWRQVLRMVDPERKDIAVAVKTERRW